MPVNFIRNWLKGNNFDDKVLIYINFIHIQQSPLTTQITTTSNGWKNPNLSQCQLFPAAARHMKGKLKARISWGEFYMMVVNYFAEQRN